ncbi:hypothetical protein GLAREA_10339 [Glarea lozoyensis ATCC 20868]|uniref:Meiotic recombination protein DMC1 n=1 Tax=Glarea lozoyensis (strain ATCC 20868 / MF5171) TaxID=1116229 RepID=S3DA81_GLAL2|nr:uncharacterized protein GLAREA_10339 [Glarea lozoyensis ATCC 20868]EPE34645.1 hypothetical protein GLAREA_10339 [Glarea lozoyensis ATCC 20868]
MTSSNAGGFLTSLPSPSPSTTSTSSTSNLPHPRQHPLKPGSQKEDAARRYVEARLLHISRRYAKKFQPELENDEVRGYTNMKDVCKDLGDVVDVLWLSGTPNLQIPNLINIASLFITYITAFPPAPLATFRFLRKLDHVFASMIRGVDRESGERLPGFGFEGRGMSRTDMVRVKSLVEGTRVGVVEYMGRVGEIEEEEEESEVSGSEAEGSAGVGGWGDMEEDSDLEMDVARVYEFTLVALNEFGFGFVPEEERIGIQTGSTTRTTGTG